MTSLLDDAAGTGERGFVVKTVFRFRTPPNLFLEMALRSPPYTRNNKKGEGEKKRGPCPSRRRVQVGSGRDSRRLGHRNNLSLSLQTFGGGERDSIFERRNPTEREVSDCLFSSSVQ